MPVLLTPHVYVILNFASAIQNSYRIHFLGMLKPASFEKVPQVTKEVDLFLPV